MGKPHAANREEASTSKTGTPRKQDEERPRACCPVPPTPRAATCCPHVKLQDETEDSRLAPRKAPQGFPRPISKSIYGVPSLKRHVSSVLSFKEGVIYTVKCMDLKCTSKSGLRRTSTHVTHTSRAAQHFRHPRKSPCAPFPRKPPSSTCWRTSCKQQPQDA